jgi:hypothetical protein
VQTPFTDQERIARLEMILSDLLSALSEKSEHWVRMQELATRLKSDDPLEIPAFVRRTQKKD